MSNLTGRAIYQKAQKPPRAPYLELVGLRESAEGQRCSLRLPCCNHDPATTVLAHLRFFNWAGIAEKPINVLGVFACSACHDALDRRVDSQVGFEDILRALGETLISHVKAGRLIFK